MSRLPIPHFIERLFAEKADKPVIVTVTVDASEASMSAADLAKLTSDMIMCWYYGDRTKLKTDLSILPGNGQQPTGTATSQTTFTIAFIHSANENSVASIIPMAGIPSTATVSIFFTIPSVPDGTNCYSASVYIGYGKQLVPNTASQTDMNTKGVYLRSTNGFAQIYVSSSSTLKGGSYNVIGNIVNA